MEELIKEYARLANELIAENERLRNENGNLRLVNALMKWRYEKPKKRGPKRKIKQEPEPTKKVGRPGLLSADMRNKLPQLIDAIKERDGLKTDTAAVEKLLIEYYRSEWRGKKEAIPVLILLSKERGKKRKPID